jgi:hypothetical protein
MGRAASLVSVVLVAVTLPFVVNLPTAQAVQPVPGHTAIVPSTPRTDTPRISNGKITDIEVAGTRVYVAGTFTQVANANGGTVNQPRLLAFNLNTGAIDAGFRPTFDRAVNEIEASPDGQFLYVVGAFNTVNGITRRKVVKLNAATGAVVTGFTANAGAKATSVDVTTNRVYVGGQFKTIGGRAMVGLAALNPTTGVVDTAFQNSLSGGLGLNGLLTVQQLVLTHDDSKLLVVHTGRQIAGQDRYGAGLIDTATGQLLAWRTRLWEENLIFVGGVQRAFAADISPDDSYFVVTSGSGGDRPPINDTVMAFPVAGNDFVDPLWISRHFDSIYSAAITEEAIYVGGHFRFQEAPGSTDPWPGNTTTSYGWGTGPGGLGAYSLGDEVLRRDQLGALDPATGKALNWNPGSSAFVGAQAMKATSRGLLVGHDGNVMGGQNIGRVGFFDFNSVPPQANVETTIQDPFNGAVVPAGTEYMIAGEAHAVNGMNRVQVEIKERSGARRFLQDDLVSWSTTWNAINAVLAAPGAVDSAWTLPVNLPGGNFRVMAKTFQVGGGSDSTKATANFETFLVDDQPPTTTVTGPPSGLTAATEFTVTGRANDDTEIVSVSYWIRNQANLLYLQEDGTFGPTIVRYPATLDTIGVPNPTWQTEVVLPEGEFRINAVARDNAGQSDPRGATRDWIIAPTGQAPTATIELPGVAGPGLPTPTIAMTPGSFVDFSGVADDDIRLQSVEVYLRNNTTGDALASDGSWGRNVTAGFFRVSPQNWNTDTYNWSFRSPIALTAGVYDFRVRATDDLGLRSNTARNTLDVSVPGDLPPNGLLDFTGTDQNIEVLHLDITGTATDDFGVAAVNVTVRDSDTSRYLRPDGTLTTQFATLPAVLGTPNGTSTTFLLSVDLPQAGDWRPTAYAVDTSGQQDTSTSGASARYLVYPGDLDPWLNPNLGSPNEGDTLTGGAIIVGGRAEDDTGIARVEVQFVNSAGLYMQTNGTFSSTERWITAFLTSPGTPGSNFNYTTPIIPADVYIVRTRARDVNDQYQQIPREVTVTLQP